MYNAHSMLLYSSSNHRQVTDQQGLPANIIFNLPTQVLQDRHRLVTDGSTCGVCLQGFQARQCIRTLPCQHPFHISCIDNWLTNHSQCPVEGSYVGSVITSTASNGRLTAGVIGNHVLGGAGNKKPGQRLKALNDRNDSAKSLPSSFTLSGSGLLATNSNKTRWVRLVFSRIKDWSVRFLNVITRGAIKDFIGPGVPVYLFDYSPWYKNLNNKLTRLQAYLYSTSFPGFSPTRPTLSLSRSVGRVGENPGNEVDLYWYRHIYVYLYWSLLWMGSVSVVT